MRHIILTMRQLELIFLSLLDVLSWIHSKGYVHGDIILDNIMITTQGQVKLVDFGLTHPYNTSDAIARELYDLAWCIYEKLPESPSLCFESVLRSLGVHDKYDDVKKWKIKYSVSAKEAYDLMAKCITTELKEDKLTKLKKDNLIQNTKLKKEDKLTKLKKEDKLTKLKKEVIQNTKEDHLHKSRTKDSEIKHTLYHIFYKEIGFDPIVLPNYNQLYESVYNLLIEYMEENGTSEYDSVIDAISLFLFGMKWPSTSKQQELFAKKLRDLQDIFKNKNDL